MTPGVNSGWYIFFLDIMSRYTDFVESSFCEKL